MFITNFPLFSLMCLHYKEIGLLDEFLTDGKQVIEDVDFYSVIFNKDKHEKYSHDNYKAYAIESLYNNIFKDDYSYVVESGLYRKLLKKIKIELDDIKYNYISYIKKTERVYMDKDLYDPELNNVGSIKEYIGTSYIFEDSFKEFVLDELSERNVKIFNMELKLGNKTLSEMIIE